MLDEQGTEILAEMVAELGSVEAAVEHTAKQALTTILELVNQGDLLTELLGPDSHGAVAAQLEPQFLVQGMSLIIAGAFFQEAYPAEMEAFFASLRERAVDVEANGSL